VQPNKVYIGGLPEHTRQEDLQSCFGKIGDIVNIELKCVDLPICYCFRLIIATELVMASWYATMVLTCHHHLMKFTDRNLTLGKLPKRVSLSTMKDFSWETKFVSNYPMVEDERLNMRVILEPVSNADNWATGQG